jgi:hypothetical protein
LTPTELTGNNTVGVQNFGVDDDYRNRLGSDGASGNAANSTPPRLKVHF